MKLHVCRTARQVAREIGLTMDGISPFEKELSIPEGSGRHDLSGTIPTLEDRLDKRVGRTIVSS